MIDVLRQLPERSIQCVVTSPPYWGLRAYGTNPQVWGGDPAHPHEWSATPPRRSRSAEDATSALELASVGGRNYEAQGGSSCKCGAWLGELGLEPTPDLFVAHLADVFDEVRRVLRDDGTLWLNLGDSYSASPRGGFDRPGPAEVGREIEGRRSVEGFDKRTSGLKPKDLVGIPWRVAFELQRRGWWLRSDCVWAKPNPMPESVRDRPTRSHEYVFLLTKSERYFYDADAVRTPYSQATMPEIGEKYGGVATKAFRQYRAQDASDAKRSMIRSLEKNGSANLKSVWWIPTQPYPEAHFATYPEEIVETCLGSGTSERGACSKCGAPWRRQVEVSYVKSPAHGPGSSMAGSRHAPHTDDHLVAGRSNKTSIAELPRVAKVSETIGWEPGCDCNAEVIASLVLDPFCGSGTSLWVARSLGRRSVGIELNHEYAALARKRCRASVPDLERFAQEVPA
ncbi:MAG TPA: site-specific DNA-methyltransferase [Thermoplasmata archaeon]|nr:site-specific DNA-methyltransferase [Thermoplasmata archaeon]